MAKCSECGKPAGLFAAMCDSCKAKLRARKEEIYRKELEERTQQALAERQERERQKRELIESLYERSILKINSGEHVFMHEMLFLPVDSLVVDTPLCDEFGIAALQYAGFNGWEIAAVVPKTVGLALTNVSVGSSSGETWGAGLGGNVVGVYVLLRKQVRETEIGDGQLRDYIENNYETLADSY